MSSAEKLGVVLIGHGAPATDCPPRLIGELMSLLFMGGGHDHGSAAAGHGHGQPQGRAAALDAQIRNWPRTPQNDPYKVGLEQFAEALRPLLPTDLFAIGYNEFCTPTIAEAVSGIIARGATRVLVIPSMLTPGGVHSEIDIPAQLDSLRRAHPQAAIDYCWPFPVEQIAALLAEQVRRSADTRPVSDIAVD